MGYDVHITRKTEWSDKDGPRITEDEWQVYVASDPEMVVTGSAEHTTPNGETIRITHPLLTEWRHHSSRTPVWFSYFEGNLCVKNPDDECLEKMRQVASRLQARVQGDEGEVYLSATEIQKEESQPSSPVRASVRPVFAFFQWPLWKQLIAAFLLGCVLLALKLLIFGG